MAVKLRMKRFGRTHHPVYRLTATDSRSPRDGRVLEELGQYDPLNEDASAQLKLNVERIQYWLGVGAQPSNTVGSLLKKQGIKAK